MATPPPQLPGKETGAGRGKLCPPGHGIFDKEYESLCFPIFQSIMDQALLVSLSMFTASPSPTPDTGLGAGSMTHCLLSRELEMILSKLKLSPKKPFLSIRQPSSPLRTEKHILRFCKCPAWLFVTCFTGVSVWGVSAETDTQSLSLAAKEIFLFHITSKPADVLRASQI